MAKCDVGIFLDFECRRNARCKFHTQSVWVNFLPRSYGNRKLFRVKLTAAEVNKAEELKRIHLILPDTHYRLTDEGREIALASDSETMIEELKKVYPNIDTEFPFRVGETQISAV
ncbi:MAG TPA: hypothetical protein VF599_12595 [Pyrinomonadaceae bacterium]